MTVRVQRRARARSKLQRSRARGELAVNVNRAVVSALRRAGPDVIRGRAASAACGDNATTASATPAARAALLRLSSIPISGVSVATRDFQRGQEVAHEPQNGPSAQPAAWAGERLVAARTVYVGAMTRRRSDRLRGQSGHEDSGHRRRRHPRADSRSGAGRDRAAHRTTDLQPVRSRRGHVDRGHPRVRAHAPAPDAGRPPRRDL